MLWVQYEASSKISADFVQDIVRGISSSIWPYPVAAFDLGEFGFGLVTCEDGVCTPSDGQSMRTSSTTDHQISEIGTASVFCNTEAASGTAILSGWGTVIQTETALTHNDISSQNANSDFDSGESGHSSPGRTSLPPNQPNLNSRAENGENISEMPGRNGSRTQSNERREQDRDDEIAGPSTERLAQSSSSGVSTREPPIDPPQEPVSRRSGTFWGRTNVYVEKAGQKSCLQELDLSFDLQVEPTKYDDGQIDCKLMVDRVGVKVSPISPGENADDHNEQVWYLVTRKVRIQIDPHNGRCLDLAQWPVHSSFVEQHSVTKSKSHALRLEVSSRPKGLWQREVETSNSETLLPVTIGVTPDYIGCGRTTGGVKWAYSVLKPFQTRLELSERVPPTHSAVLRVDPSAVDDVPESLVVSVGAVYGRRRGSAWKRMTSRLPPKLRIFSDINIAHLEIVLEARIDKIRDDWFSFPGQGKNGCSLSMDMVFPMRGLNGLPIKAGGSEGSTALLSASGRVSKGSGEIAYNSI
jgi:hypothetical protein